MNGASHPAAVLVLVEHADGEPDELSLQALALARSLGGPVEALLLGGAEVAARLAVEVAHVVSVEGAFAPAAAAALAQVAAETEPVAVLGSGSDRGNEALARLGARLDLPFAANCVEVRLGDPLAVTRQRWGGSLLEEALLHGRPAILSVAPHAVAAAAPGAAAEVRRHEAVLADADGAAALVETIPASSGGVSLADAKVVVSGGRGVGSAEGFAVIEELAALLRGAVGCSRVVTSNGWRPHADQVGQTGTKIAPELYIACGISGATQHIAGCRGAKRILAINDDPEAPILSSADYAVIGDLHAIVPAISAELRRARGA